VIERIKTRASTAVATKGVPEESSPAETR
jgi:hypothetical protein